QGDAQPIQQVTTISHRLGTIFYPKCSPGSVIGGDNKVLVSVANAGVPAPALGSPVNSLRVLQPDLSKILVSVRRAFARSRHTEFYGTHRAASCGAGRPFSANLTATISDVGIASEQAISAATWAPAALAKSSTCSNGHPASSPWQSAPP